jgi:hypothetical protein
MNEESKLSSALRFLVVSAKSVAGMRLKDKVEVSPSFFGEKIMFDTVNEAGVGSK